MVDCPRTYALFIFLMGCSYALVGLLTLWAATSPRHWFLRTAVVLGCAALFLWRPMYEPFFGVLWMQLFVWLSLAAAREWRRWRASQKLGRGWRWRSSWRPRFTVVELGFVVIPVAICSAAFSKASDQARWGCLYGAIEALVVTVFVLLGVWCGTTTNRKAAKFTVVLAALALFGFIAYWSQFGPIGFIQNWAWRARFLQHIALLYNAAYWFLTFLLVVLFVELVVKLAVSATRDTVKRRTNAIVIGSIVAIISIGPGYIGWLVSHPLPIPPEPLLRKVDLISLRELNQKAEHIQRQKTTGKLVAELCHEVEATIPDDSYLPIDFTSGAFPRIKYSDCLFLMRVLRNQVVDAFGQDDFVSAMDAFERMLRLAKVLNHGAMESYLVRETIEKSAIECLESRFRLLDLKSTEQAQTILISAAKNRTPLANFVLRDQVRKEHTAGWQWNAVKIMEEVTGEDKFPRFLVVSEWRPSKEKRSIARLRLMLIELAIHRHQLLTGSFPDTLEEISQLPSEMLEDPFRVPAPTNFKYQRRENSYKLYSVGPDERDDSGMPMRRFSGSPRDSGDFFLD